MKSSAPISEPARMRADMANGVPEDVGTDMSRPYALI